MTGREGGAQSRGAGGRGGFPGGGGGAGVRFIWLPCRTGTATQPPLMTLCKRYLGIRKCPPPKERYQNFNRLLGSGRGHAVFYTKNIQDWKVETILPTMLRIKPLGRRIKMTSVTIGCDMSLFVWYLRLTSVFDTFFDIWDDKMTNCHIMIFVWNDGAATLQYEKLQHQKWCLIN